MIKILNSINLSNTIDIPEENRLYVEGYCMHFNVVNMNREMVLPGAFDEFFKILKEKNNMPVMNAFHKSDLIIGLWTSLKQDENGLWVEGYVDLNIKYVADNIAPLIRTGALNNLSTEGFVDYNDIEPKEDHYIVNKMILTGISLVPIGADLDTKFIPKEVRNYIDPEEQKNPKENSATEPKSKNLLLFYI